jgi:hypothetical protein
MEFAKLTLEFLRVLIWPAVATVALFLFRKEAISMLTRVQEAKFPGGISLSFAAELAEAQGVSLKVEAAVSEEAKNYHGPSIPLSQANARLLQLKLQPSPSGLDLSYYQTIATRDTNLALAGLQIELEIAGRNLAEGFGVQVDGYSGVRTLFDRLRRASAIGADQADLAGRILSLCNLAVRGQFVSQLQASELIRLAQILIDDYVGWLGWGFSQPWDQKAE